MFIIWTVPTPGCYILQELARSLPLNIAFPVVGIGASAGGLEALTALLEELSAKSGFAFVVVQHLAPAHESMLADILGRSVRMPVRTIKDGMRVEVNRVYVKPPNCELLLSQGAFRLTPREASNRLHLPIDNFFRSLAENQKNRAISI